MEEKGKRNWPMEIHIYYGKTGTGKSFTANKVEDCFKASWPEAGSIWWFGGYRGQDTIWLDEFRHQVTQDMLLGMFDRYEYTRKVKHQDDVQITSHRIIVTTNMEPVNWYPNLSRAQKVMLERRLREFAVIYDFEEIIAFDMNRDPVVRMTPRDMSSFRMAEAVPIQNRWPGIPQWHAPQVNAQSRVDLQSRFISPFH